MAAELSLQMARAEEVQAVCAAPQCREKTRTRACHGQVHAAAGGQASVCTGVGRVINRRSPRRPSAGAFQSIQCLVNATAGGVAIAGAIGRSLSAISPLQLSEGEEGAAARAGALLLGGGEGEQDRALDCEIEVGVGDESCAALS